ncbi:MAG TPA: glycosyltransferase family 4 protein [Bryobacteraceae bacterium]|nr:glycosyltransferase family 4 protein [Bryobacteraceae bacterium]
MRWLVYLWAMVGLSVRLCRHRPVRHRTAVYLYMMAGPLTLYTSCLCKALGFPVVQELCEWPPGNAGCSGFTKWLYRKPIFALATGVLVISKAIERHVGERSAAVNPNLLIHRLPAVVDAERFANAPSGMEETPHFVWCGTWLKDALFLIRALALVKLAGHQCKLAIIGACAEWNRDTIRDYVVEQGLVSEDVVLVGCVDDPTLDAWYKKAAALLVPLWNDEVSETRMPNKLPEYLASGRPIVACRIGDLTSVLADNVNAYLGEPANERDFADRMIAVLRNPAEAQRIGAAGQQICLEHFDYRAHADRLAEFFTRCINCRE